LGDGGISKINRIEYEYEFVMDEDEIGAHDAP